jgi:hypothetical protein
MQFLITVNDHEHGLGSGTERSLTEQIEHMVGLWDRMPGITARLEAHEDDVYGTEPGVCGACGHTLTTYGDTDGSGDPIHVFCDICGKAEHPADLTSDWNGETGEHLSCRDLRAIVARSVDI